MLIEKKLPIICLVGPTATGKTQLALNLFKYFPVEIISVDSVMVYQGMNIGTAKPDQHILSRVPHHLINICYPTQPYSVGKFFKDVKICIEKILSNHRIPLLVGGTMLYFNALRKGLSMLPNSQNYSNYRIVRQQLEEMSLKDLYQKLIQCDPCTAKRLHHHDTQRIQRALLVYLLTGKPITALYQNKLSSLPYDLVWIGLLPKDRSILRESITTRFEKMLEQGLVEEVETLQKKQYLLSELPAARSVGYRQVKLYLSGALDWHQMKTQSITATCQLAKRQLTWLRGWKNIKFFDPNDSNLFLKVQHCIRAIY